MPLLAPPLLSFFFNDTSTTEIYTLSLHDALPILDDQAARLIGADLAAPGRHLLALAAENAGQELCIAAPGLPRSEEHTSELQSRPHLVCRLLLEKKKGKEIV